MQQTTQKLASAFLIASLATNIMGSLNNPKVIGEDLTFEKSSVQQNNVLAQQAELLEQGGMSTEPISFIMSQTSLIAVKTPPPLPVPVKKQVVISRQSLFVTAYSSTPDQTDDTPFITAWNTPVRDGIVAANFLRFGAKVRFPTLYGDKIFMVEDRMNERYPYRVDIWMRTREEAKQFGVKIVPIEVIKEI